MNAANLILSENPDFKIVICRFKGTPKDYRYKTFFDVKEGDLAVVDSPSDGPVVVKVTDVLSPMEFSGDYSLKWLMSVVDVEGYDNLKALDRKVTKTVNQLKHKREREQMMADLQATIGDEGIAAVKGLVRL